MFVLSKQKQISMWFRIAPWFASLSTNLAPEQSIRVRRITSEALGALAVVNSGSRCGTCWPRGSFVSVPSPKGVNWRAPAMHPLPHKIYKTPAIPSQKEYVFFWRWTMRRLLLPPAHTNSPGLDRVCVRPDGGVPRNRIKKARVVWQRGKIKLYTAEAIASERALGRWRRGVVGTRLFCTLRNMFRGPWCERAREMKNKKVPKTSFFTFVGRFIGRA